jgi:peroxiredoxin Q/BCP
MLKEGQKAPDFSLQDDSGQTVTLKSLRGKKVVLYFYPKDDTPGCTKEACDFQIERKKFANMNAVILGVSADGVESHVKFKKKYGLAFPLLSDPERTAINAYGVWKEKSMYGKTYMGIERTTVIIDEKGNVQKIFPKVKVTRHIEVVLENLN